MIKATGRDNEGNQVLILALTRDNVERLLQDQPIRIESSELASMGAGESFTIVLLGGEDEAELTSKLGVTDMPESEPGVVQHAWRDPKTGEMVYRTIRQPDDPSDN